MATTYERLDLKPSEARYGQRYVWELPVRISHWTNVLCIPTLFATGLYIASPQLSPNGEAWQHFFMGRAREIHFLAGYLLLFSFILRVYWFYMGNNYARSGFPFVWRKAWWADLRAQALQYLRLDRGHVHLGHKFLLPSTRFHPHPRFIDQRHHLCLDDADHAGVVGHDAEQSMYSERGPVQRIGVRRHAYS